MITKKIPYKELKPSIYAAFNGDKAIFSLYDPNVSVSTINELTEDVMRKIKEWGELNYYAVYEKNKLIGYFVNLKNQLISFGISVRYRVKKYLKVFFEIIKGELGNDFFVLLWQRNVRAKKWLLKNNLVVSFSDNNIIKLQCQ